MSHFMYRLYIISFLLLLVSGCEKSEFEVIQDKYTKELGWVLNADPQEDVNKAINNKDFIFLGVYGINNPIPSIKRSCINVETDVKYIEGTSEVSFGYEHKKLNTIAYMYADDYNFHLSMYLTKNTSFKCDS